MSLDATRMFRLDGRTALVTGANGGIGAATATLFAQAGADIALGIRPGADPGPIVAAVRHLGQRAEVFEADLNDVAQIRTLAERAHAWLGRLDVLVNNAGAGVGGPILNMTVEDWNYTLNINTRAAYFMAQASAQIMKAQGGGKIINIASVNAYRGFPGGSLYNLSKAAVVSMTQSMGAEWAPYHINVNAIAPGWTDTKMTAPMPADRRQWVRENVPMVRWASPDEISPMALFLACAASDYATGATFPVDGGFLNAGLWGDAAWMPSAEAE